MTNKMITLRIMKRAVLPIGWSSKLNCEGKVLQTCTFSSST